MARRTAMLNLVALEDRCLLSATLPIAAPAPVEIGLLLPAVQKVRAVLDDGTVETSASGGGGGAGKAHFQDLHFVGESSAMLLPAVQKVRDAANRSASQATANSDGIHLEDILVSNGHGGGETEYTRVTLSDVLVTS